MEIERKFLIKSLPENLENYPSSHLQQGYLSTGPVVRVRKDDDTYTLTYKGGGMMMREEYNLPLNKQSYEHLLAKADGNIITKRRYRIPFDERHTIELDIFEGRFEGLVLAEVEFETKEEAENFLPPDWFGEDVTYDRCYHNSFLSRLP
ncbi:MAG: CYTH domain-containing protein [Lachnospiraceae bacterium]|nr:CYTH domain-containing protein [Lachnospiraceae bacterium]